MFQLCIAKLIKKWLNRLGEGGASCTLEVGEISFLSKATHFHHCLGLRQKPPQKIEGPL